MPVIDREPESSRVCVLCGCGQISDQSAMGKFLWHDGTLVDAHLKCADDHKLHAVDAFIRDGE